MPQKLEISFGFAFLKGLKVPILGTKLVIIVVNAVFVGMRFTKQCWGSKFRFCIMFDFRERERWELK